MKILHTSDWHLGQKLLHNDREEEHRLALDWLLDTIRGREVDVLLVAGDVFDIGNPPNYARKRYYSFLTSLLQTSCRHVIITGGNHDSPAMLNAPRELLQTLNIHIVGSATANLEEEVVVLKDKAGKVEGVVAAIPFLRDKDLRFSFAGEGQAERQARLQDGLRQHYLSCAELAAGRAGEGVPIIAMGHLYAKGAVSSARQDNIYIGNRENMEAGHFPAQFHYVALGHIHRPQCIGDCRHIRYSGSLIPLSFSETLDDKSVSLLHFDGCELKDIETVPVPVFRRLKTIEGDLEKVKSGIERFVSSSKTRLLTPWVEVVVQTDHYIPQLDVLLREFCQDMDIELLKIRVERPFKAIDSGDFAAPDLEDLDVDDVFRRKCESQGELPGEEWETLKSTFHELKDWMEEQEGAN